MDFRLVFLILISVSVLSVFSFADFSGTINLTETGNSSGIVTGIYGSTHPLYCNSSSHCASGDRCALDWDGLSYGTSRGWCTVSGASCANHSAQTATPKWQISGFKFCNDTYTAISCSSGSWGVVDCNATNKTCSAGECISGITTTTAPGGGSDSSSTTTTSPDQASLKVKSKPNDFDLIQGGSIVKRIIVENDGDFKLYDVAMTISGIPSSWYTITKSKFNSISIGSTATFIINFTVPENGTVKSHPITATIKPDDGSTTTTASFKLKVLPSEETVEQVIKPRYTNYTTVLEGLENEIKQLEMGGTNVTELWELYNLTKDKLDQANNSMGSGDYFTMNELLNEAQNLIGDINLKMDELRAAGLGDLLVPVAIVVVILIVGGVLAYLFLPESYRPSFIPGKPAFKPSAKPRTFKPMTKPAKEAVKTAAAQPSNKLSDIKDAILKMRKSKRQEKKEKFKYEFKR